jgi:hypothetical protein
MWLSAAKWTTRSKQFIPFQRIEIGSITGIGKRIEHNDAVGWMQVSPIQNEIGADEPSAAGDQ